MSYDILIVSTSCSKQMYDTISAARTKKSLDPAQRVFLTLAQELKRLGNSVTCISSVPYSRNNVNLKAFERTEETVGGIKYIYPGFRMGTFNRLIDVGVNGRTEIKNWVCKKSKHEKVLICDSLVIPLCYEARRLCKSNGIRSYAYVTDYPSLATSIKSTSGFSIKTLLQRCIDSFADMDIRKYDGYILVAEKLIELIKPKRNNYIVVEDLAEIPDRLDREMPRNEAFTILYGGALCERFGINKLVDAITMLPDSNVRMFFYGSGESVEYIKKIAEKDKRIIYGGVVPYDELQTIQKKADLLVNPRPSDEVFAGYSFPSKTTSYMISGTPVLTTKIPGIPKEYYPHLFLFFDETADDMSKRILQIRSIPTAELYQMGQKAFTFLAEQKGSKKQTQRIISFLNENLK